MKHTVSINDFNGLMNRYEMASTTEHGGKKLLVISYIVGDEVKSEFYVMMMKNIIKYQGPSLSDAVNMYNSLP